MNKFPFRIFAYLEVIPGQRQMLMHNAETMAQAVSIKQKLQQRANVRKVEVLAVIETIEKGRG